MKHSFDLFWREFKTRGKFGLLLRRCKKFWITEEELIAIAQLAYNRGGQDMLLEQNDVEVAVLEKIREGIRVDAAHSEHRWKTGQEHFFVQPPKELTTINR